MAHVSFVPNDILLDLENSSQSLRLLRLPHPRTGALCLFLPQQNTPSMPSHSSAILEVQAVAPHSCRSWFLDDGQVIADGKLLVMTPIDPVFLLLPILLASQPADGSAGIFRQSDDIFEEAASRLSCALGDPGSASSRGSDVMTFATLDCTYHALRRLCDVKDLTEELSVYRFSRAVLLETLRTKVAHLSRPENFDTFPSLYRRLARDGLMNESREELRQAGRMRASCESLSQYLPPDVMNHLLASYDFTDLDAHIQTLVGEDDQRNRPPPMRDTGALRESETDKKRKAPSQLSKGVSKLMKANTRGMAKISTFFAKPAK